MVIDPGCPYEPKVSQPCLTPHHMKPRASCTCFSSPRRQASRTQQHAASFPFCSQFSFPGPLPNPCSSMLSIGSSPPLPCFYLQSLLFLHPAPRIQSFLRERSCCSQFQERLLHTCDQQLQASFLPVPPQRESYCLQLSSYRQTLPW